MNTIQQNIYGFVTYKKMFLLANSVNNWNTIWDLSLSMVLLNAKEDWVIVRYHLIPNIQYFFQDVILQS